MDAETVLQAARRAAPWAWGVRPKPGDAVGGFPACALPVDVWNDRHCTDARYRSLARARRWFGEETRRSDGLRGGMNR